MARNTNQRVNSVKGDRWRGNGLVSVDRAGCRELSEEVQSGGHGRERDVLFEEVDPLSAFTSLASHVDQGPVELGVLRNGQGNKVSTGRMRSDGGDWSPSGQDRGV